MSMSNQPGTPRDDGEMGGNFLNPFQSESVSIFLWSCFTLGTFVPGILFKRKKKIHSVFSDAEWAFIRCYLSS